MSSDTVIDQTSIVVLTNDKHLWLLRPFAYLFNQFWGAAVTVAGYGRPEFELPDNFSFVSIAPHNYPANRWSDGLIWVLNHMTRSHVILMLEDYWLNAPVNEGCVAMMFRYAWQNPDVLRIDLTADRVTNGRC